MIVIALKNLVFKIPLPASFFFLLGLIAKLHTLFSSFSLQISYTREMFFYLVSSSIISLTPFKIVIGKYTGKVVYFEAIYLPKF